MVFEFYRRTLNPYEQKIYDNFVKDFLAGRDTTDFDSTVGTIRIPEIMEAIARDHVEIFYLGNEYVYSEGKHGRLRSKFIYSPREIEVFKKEMEKDRVAVNLLINRTAFNALEREKIIVNYLLDSVTYEVNDTFNQNAGEVLYKMKGQCSGISRAFKFICDCFSIPCIFISGDLDNGESIEPHAWNIITVNNKSYHVDITYMLTSACSTKRNYNCFNVSDKKCAELKHDWDRRLYPSCFENDDSIRELMARELKIPLIETDSDFIRVSKQMIADRKTEILLVLKDTTKSVDYNLNYYLKLFGDALDELGVYARYTLNTSIEYVLNFKVNYK